MVIFGTIPRNDLSTVNFLVAKRPFIRYHMYSNSNLRPCESKVLLQRRRPPSSGKGEGRDKNSEHVTVPSALSMFFLSPATVINEQVHISLVMILILYAEATCSIFSDWGGLI